MQATLLRQTTDYVGPTDPNFTGAWVDDQDPLTGEIVRVWAPAEELPDDPDTPEYDPSSATIDCVARGFSNNNRFTSKQIFGDDYKNIDVVRMWVPNYVNVTKSDRITNIRDNTGHVLWIEDFLEGAPQAAMFNVVGVTPQLGPFNNHMETFLILERAEV
jgi:hypothetical protein